MEIFDVSIYNILKKPFWRRRGYQRIDYETKKRKIRVARFGGNVQSRKYWRINAKPKLKLRVLFTSPLKLLTKLKNAYINMMNNLAGNVGSLNINTNVFGNKRIPKARQVENKKVYYGNELEMKLVYEMYMALVVDRQLGPR